MLAVRNISLQKNKEGRQLPILKEISLDIPKGRVSLLLGKSGSGKTSLLRSMAQLENQYKGEIIYNKKDLSKIKARELCQIIGFVPQSFALFPHMNVLDNCLRPLANRSLKKDKDLYLEVVDMLTSLDMEEYLLYKPHQLSGGQQQRIAIARALLLQPSFLLLDEPTSALDPENTKILVIILQKLIRSGKGIVISTQDMTFAEQIFDRVFFLEDGALIERYDGQEKIENRPHSKLEPFCPGIINRLAKKNKATYFDMQNPSHSH